MNDIHELVVFVVFTNEVDMIFNSEFPSGWALHKESNYHPRQWVVFTTFVQSPSD